MAALFVATEIRGNIRSQVRPRRVRPVRWQIKGCQTTEPRTFDSGFSGKVNLSTLSFMVHLSTYLLPSVYPITYLGYPLYVRPSLTLPLYREEAYFAEFNLRHNWKFFYSHYCRLRSSYVRSLIGTGTLYYAAVSVRSLWSW